MVRTALIAATLFALSGCVEVQQAVDDTARQGSKGVVTEILATRFPQVPKELITPFTDCIIDNADALELRGLLSARNAGIAFDLRCEVRETVMEFLRTQMPEALVRSP